MIFTVILYMLIEITTFIIPRFLWKNNPFPGEQLGNSDYVLWVTTCSIVGDFMRWGGISFLFFGSILTGIFAKMHEKIYNIRKKDGSLLIFIIFYYMF
ncbi:hypothetical protein kam1_1670 [Methylacidiphilum kamchatkense Kam1]|uniref:Uncharacterized protein n=1 Tax=Methylacidiphilum kamchatkense Kam1 TaxID=1202785 RepID=A0A516TNU9_9BACT|nr:hypothetical protein kam1_1670 [Methylacidiphilum kamchatkense Kam1]